MTEIGGGKGMFAVYADTVRHTPGRPEQGTAAAYQGLWLLPKADMADIRNTMNKVRARSTVSQLALQPQNTACQ